MYGFRKIKEDNFHYYLHPFFSKHHPELSWKISRKPEKKVSMAIPPLKKDKKQHTHKLLSYEDIEREAWSKEVPLGDISNFDLGKLENGSCVSIKPSGK
jgi:hypothetical protein